MVPGSKPPRIQRTLLGRNVLDRADSCTPEAAAGASPAGGMVSRSGGLGEGRAILGRAGVDGAIPSAKEQSQRVDSDRSGGCPHHRGDHYRIGPHQRIEQRDTDHDHRSINDGGPNDHGTSCNEASGNEASGNEATGNFGAYFATYDFAAYDFAADDTPDLRHDPPDTDHLRSKCVPGSSGWRRVPD